MDLGLTDKVAIVGGGSKGIGRAAAEALAREGASVVIVARHAEELDAAAAAMGGEGRVLRVTADLAQPADIERVVAEATARFGKVDIVVNNLGGPPAGQPSELTDEQWHAAFEISFQSAVRMNRLVLPGMRERGFGRIVSVLSGSIKEPEDNLALSTVARTALAAYAKQLALEVAKDGVTVNNVLPGSIETGRLQAVAEMQARFRGRPEAGAMDDRRARIAAGRFGRLEEIGDVICFLCSERASYVTGQHIAVDGGQVRAMW